MDLFLPPDRCDIFQGRLPVTFMAMHALVTCLTDRVGHLQTAFKGQAIMIDSCRAPIFLYLLFFLQIILKKKIAGFF